MATRKKPARKQPPGDTVGSLRDQVIDLQIDLRNTREQLAEAINARRLAELAVEALNRELARVVHGAPLTADSFEKIPF